MRLPSYVSALAAVLLGASTAPLLASEEPVGVGRRSFAERPLEFVPNRGQWPAEVVSRARAPEATLWLRPDGWTVDLERVLCVDAEGRPEDGRHAALSMTFVEARAQAPRGEARQPGWRNHIQGDDPSRWVGHLPAFARQRYVDLYDGVDVLVRGDEGLVRYDLVLDEGADLDAVVLQVEGVEGLSLAHDGALLIETALGTLVQPAPITWTVLADGSTETVDCHYRLLGDGRFGFEAPGFDFATPLVVDPTLEWGTFLGGAYMDYAFASVSDEHGGVTVVGYTMSSAYPTTLGAYDVSYNGVRDAYITRLSTNGQTLVYSTLLGGAGVDEARAVTLAPNGDVIVAGLTSSVDFPVTGATYGTGFAGGGALTGSDAYVARLDAQGSLLRMAAYLGGSEDEWATDVAADDEGNVFVTGLTRSTDFPATPGAVSQTFGGGSGAGDAWLTRLSVGGSVLDYATYLGGSADDCANAVLPVGDGRVLVTGWSASADFPMPLGGAQEVFAGVSDTFLLKVAADGSRLVQGTWIGGSSDDQAMALVRDAAGRVLVGGATRSPDLPVTSGAPQTEYQGGWMLGDAYVARLDRNLRNIEFLTYLGGEADDAAKALSALPNGKIGVTGSTASGDLATTPDALDHSLGGALDAFLAVIDGDVGEVETLSYLGGSDSDNALSIVIHDDGRAMITGYSTSFDFPVTAGAYDETFDGSAGWNSDSFVVAFDLGDNHSASGDWLDMGFPTVGSYGDAQLQATGSLAPGEGGELHLSGFKPLAMGRLLMGFEAGYVPLKGGVVVPFPVTSEIFVRTTILGELDLPYLNTGKLPSGLSFYVQAWILDDTGPFQWTASNALHGVVP